MKKILFLCGSPRGSKSASLSTAQYMTNFLEYEYEFLDVVKAKLSKDPTEAEPAFLDIVKKMEKADAIIWTFGAWVLFVPVQMQYLFDKLFAQNIRSFEGKIAASVLTSVRVLDDYILDRMKFVSEQLRMGYIGDVSAEGNPFFGYVDELETENSCRVLAGRINRALNEEYVPVRDNEYISGEYMSPVYKGEGFEVTGATVKKTGDRTILVIAGNNLENNPAGASVYESIKRYSKNSVELIEVERAGIGPCIGCYLCDFKVEGRCVLKDGYEDIKKRLHEADSIVYIGNCASGMVDVNLKALLDRGWGMAHRPSLKDKYGFVAVSGGGPIGKDAAWFLQKCTGKYGIKYIGALSENTGKLKEYADTVRKTVEDLDRAMDEGWIMADRYTVKTISGIFRDLVLEDGAALRADYKFHKENGLFDYPSNGLGKLFMRWVFSSQKLQQKLTDMRKNQILEGRKKRLENLASLKAGQY